MRTGLYKDSGGGDQNVIEVDEVGNRMLVDYGEGKQVWYGAEDFSTWSFVEPEVVTDVPRDTPEDTEENSDITFVTRDATEDEIKAVNQFIETLPPSPVMDEKPKPVKKKAAKKKPTEKKPPTKAKPKKK